MRLKNDIYKSEQSQIISDLYSILIPNDLDFFILYDLEHDLIKIQSIMDLFPKIKQFFTMSNLPALAYPENCKRPYLSVAKILLKKRYKIISAECRIKEQSKTLRTMKYTLISREQ